MAARNKGMTSGLPLVRRKALLAQVLPGGPRQVQRARGGRRGRLFRVAAERGLEGVIAKRPLLPNGHRRMHHPPTWVVPEVVCRVAFASWTEAGVLRQASFLGLVDDREPRTVTRERVLLLGGDRSVHSGMDAAGAAPNAL